MTVQIQAGYKQTEVGVIPEDWEVVELRDLLKIKNGFAFSSHFFGEKGEVLLTPGNFKLDGGLYFNQRNTKFYSGPFNNSAILGRDDLVIVMTDLTPDCQLLGKPAFVDEERILLHNQRIGKIILLGSLTSKRFLYWYFLSDYHARRMKETATGSTVRHTSVKSIYEGRIALPRNMSEQQAIAEALSDADALIESLEQLIAKKRQVKQGAMQELLTGQRRLPGFSGEWLATRLGDVAEFFKGKGLPKSQITPDGSDACIHYGELFTHYPETINKIIGRTNGEKDSFRSLDNDVLMPTSDVTPRGLAKASCLRVNDVVLGGDILVIRSDKNKINGSFLSYLIRNNEDSVLQLVTGSTVFHLYGSDMKNFIFSMPSISEQNEIVSILSAIDAELNVLETRLSKASQIKQGMMQKLLTGRIRLI